MKMLTWKGFLVLAAVVAVGLFLSACSRRYLMPAADHFLAPVDLPDMFTIVYFDLNPALDKSEGRNGRFSWLAVNWDKDGKESRLLALNVGRVKDRSGKALCIKKAFIMIPKPLTEVAGTRIAMLDHSGRRLFNQSGQYQELKSLWREIKPDDYKDHLTVIDPAKGFAVEVTRGSRDYQELLDLYARFRINEITAARKYVYKKYGSSLTEKQLEKIASNDSIVKSFADWLGRDWKLFLTYPFMGVTKTALIAGVVKIFTLPSIWGDKINQPGFSEYIMDSFETMEAVIDTMVDYRCLATP